MTDLTLEQALEAAHPPVLCAVLAHVTGDADAWLQPRWRPVYNPLDRNDIGITPEDQADLRARAAVALQPFVDARHVPPPPSPEITRRIMSHVAGADIPDAYVEFLLDEMALEGTSSRDPRWEPAQRQAARRMKVLVIGAGMSGLLAGIRLKQAGVPFEIVDKNPDVGGTWLENTYPGCRVDSSNHMYSYSFEPHVWPQYFSTQPVLLDYFRGVADRHGLRPHIRLNTTVLEAAWDEARALWRVRLRTPDGAEETVEANAVITAVGQLNRPRLPDIPGRDSFAGVAFHSAEWRHDVDLTGKRVAVIGTGASAFQFVPEIAPAVGQLTVFQRTPPWAFPAPHYHDDIEAPKNWLMQHLPAYAKWWRFYLFWSATDGFIPAVTAEPGWSGPPTAVGQANAEFRELLAISLAAQAQDRPDLLPHVIPEYPVGGKRALLDNGVWIAALKRDNVRLVTESITEITPEGLVTADGGRHAADVIIYGTGFHASRFLMPMRIRGRGGVDLHEQWAGDARAYLGMTVPGFPNLFMLYGPNTNIVVNGSIIFFSECSVRYVVGCLQLLAETGASALEVRGDVHDAFNARVDAANALMAWGAPQSKSWYKNETGRVSQNWPFPLVDYWRATLKPDPADFRLTEPAQAVAAE